MLFPDTSTSYPTASLSAAPEVSGSGFRLGANGSSVGHVVLKRADRHKLNTLCLQSAPVPAAREKPANAGPKTVTQDLFRN